MHNCMSIYALFFLYTLPYTIVVPLYHGHLRAGTCRMLKFLITETFSLYISLRGLLYLAFFSLNKKNNCQIPAQSDRILYTSMAISKTIICDIQKYIYIYICVCVCVCVCVFLELTAVLGHLTLCT